MMNENNEELVLISSGVRYIPEKDEQKYSKFHRFSTKFRSKESFDPTDGNGEITVSRKK